MKNKPIPLYPLKFTPILKEKVWGGNKLQAVLNKDGKENIGESWELCDVNNDVSIVANGPLKGKTIKDLLGIYKGKLVGDKVYEQFGDTFPLLFKFIDAREDLSVQVHPGDDLAKKRHNSFGKTEMWYILDGDQDARIILGFKKKLSRKQYLKALSENGITDFLNSEIVTTGDAFIVNPGTVHAIGAGILLAEVQQTSDVTYRIYDWDRPDTNGVMRALHIDLALEAIDFSLSNAKLDYAEQMDVPVLVGKTAFFEVNKLTLTKPFIHDLSSRTSFRVYMCVEGKATIESNGFKEEIRKGETVLLPAELWETKFDTTSASFLEVYIP